MRHTNPPGMAADLGMLLAFTLTALLGLSAAVIDADASNIYSVDFTLPDPARLRLNPRRAQAATD